MLNKFDRTSFTHSKVHKQLQEEPILEYKLLLLGDPGVGHTTFLKRFKSYESDYNNHSHMGVTILPLTFVTSKGRIKFNIWESTSWPRRSGIEDPYYITTDCAIIMFDMTAKVTLRNVPRWYRNVCRFCEEIPVVLVGNKFDLPEKRMKAKHITGFAKKKYLDYFEMSAKANYNVIEPFRELMRKLVGDPELEILEGPELEEPEIKISSEVIATLMEEKHCLSYSPPHSDDDL